MNDEIKEILKEIESYENEEVCLIILSQEQNKALLNYITNLQQENEELKKKIDRRYYKNEYERIKKENEELKEVNENLLRYVSELILYIDDYKSRCEKAIDKLKRDYYINYNEHNDDVVNMTLNILQNGSEKDER